MHYPFELQIILYLILNINYTLSNVNERVQFNSDREVVLLSEDSGVGSKVGTYIVEDSSKTVQIISYSLKSTLDGRSQLMFKIDKETAQITTVQPLDRELIDIHYFKIIATIGNSENERDYYSTFMVLVINITDSNDNSPVFEKNLQGSAIYNVTLHESKTRVGTLVYQLRADDSDIGTNAKITYSLVSTYPQINQKFFRVNTNTGRVTLKRPLDNEEHSSYALTVLASDSPISTNEKRSSKANILVTVVDDNDCAPIFSKSHYRKSVREDTAIGSTIYTVTAKDADSTSPNNDITYSIRRGNLDSVFRVHRITGKIKLIKSLDYERHKEYNLTIKADDGGRPKNSNITYLHIKILDINDNKPEFKPSSYEIRISENSSIGQQVLKVSAYDKDVNAKLTYSLKSNEQIPFSLNSSTGQLTITKRLDREHRERYSFIVKVKDEGLTSHSIQTQVLIHVQDINDNEPRFEKSVYRVDLPEETSIGAEVLKVKASDSDSGTNSFLTYKLLNSDSDDMFTLLYSSSGAILKLVKSLNYEEKAKHILTVQVKDGGGLTDISNININVIDANSHYPEFPSQSYISQISENSKIGDKILTVHAEDNDIGENGRVTYTLISCDNMKMKSENISYIGLCNIDGVNISRPFRVDPDRGDVILSALLDRESFYEYQLVIKAVDNGPTIRHTTTCDVEINVSDENDNRPLFLSDHLDVIKVIESAAIRTKIGIIKSVDYDIGQNADIRYTLTGPKEVPFEIEPKSGILRLKQKLDREQIAYYNITVTVHDMGTPTLSTSRQLLVEIIDVNDNAPKFITPLIFDVLESTDVGAHFATIKATDPDEGDHALISYNIVGGTYGFRIDKQTGYLFTTRNFDFESDRTEFTFIVRASSEHLLTDTEVKVKVRDSNDHIPTMPANIRLIMVNHFGAFPSDVAITIPATDLDQDDTLSYDILRGNEAGLLHLDSNTGDVTLDGRLNSDVSTNATMLVSATEPLLLAMSRYFFCYEGQHSQDPRVRVTLASL